MMVGEQGSHRANKENGGEGVLCFFFFNNSNSIYM